MKRTISRRCAVAAFATGLALLTGFASSVAAQKTAAETPSAKTSTPRLPNYYAKLSPEEQQVQLRAVTKEFAPKIQQKRQELQTLIAERNAALDKILTAEQRAELTKLRDAASADEPPAETTEKSKSKAKAKKAA